MKKSFTTFLVSLLMIFAASFLLTGCEAIGDIFSAGVYTGVFFVIAIIVVIIVIVVKVGKK
jgi:uncharacterized lipoprotein YajG